MKLFAALIPLCLALAGPAALEGHALKPHPGRSTDQPRPRDGNIAIQEELDAARAARTLDAYDLFLRRHGDHPLAAAARRERAAIAGPAGK
jgi:hypothetical protein